MKDAKKNDVKAKCYISNLKIYQFMKSGKCKERKINLGIMMKSYKVVEGLKNEALRRRYEILDGKIREYLLLF